MIEGLEKKTVSAPHEHKFTMQSVGGQILAVFTETTSGNFQFSSARHRLWTPLPKSIYSVSFVNYLFGPEPKGNCCGSGGGSSSRSAFFLLWLTVLTHVCLSVLFCSVCCKSVHIFYTNDVQNRLCEGKLGSVFIYMSYLHIWFGAGESVSAVWVFV